MKESAMTLDSSVTEIAGSIFRLQFEIPYNVQPVNIYLLDAEPKTLIDTGAIMEGMTDEVPKALERIGFPPRCLERIILTHHHPDHMGLAARLKRNSGARVVCHKLGVPYVTDYLGESRKMFDYIVSRSAYMGLDRRLVEANVHKMNEWFEVAESVEVDVQVEDGTELSAGPDTLKVIHTPGHCIDHICLYLERARLMFTGDMLLHSITPNPELYPPWVNPEPSGLPDYVRSLEKIRNIDVDVALPGHGKPIAEFRGRVEEVLRHHVERMDYILDTLEGGAMTVLQLALDLISFIEAEQTVENVFLAMREVFGHLVILMRRGTVVEEMSGDIALFSSAD